MHKCNVNVQLWSSKCNYELRCDNVKGTLWQRNSIHKHLNISVPWYFCVCSFQWSKSEAHSAGNGDVSSLSEWRIRVCYECNENVNSWMMTTGGFKNVSALLPILLICFKDRRDVMGPFPMIFSSRPTALERESEKDHGRAERPARNQTRI